MPTPFGELEAFLKTRNRALESLDMEYAEKAMPTASPELRLMAMHKARYECTSLTITARHGSAAWLRDRNLKRLDGSPLLPEGELPE